MQYLKIDSHTVCITGGKSVTDYNVVRRHLMSKIKNPAIDIVYVSKNTTCYSDENIQLRLNMAPIEYAEPNSIIYRHEIGPCEIYAENTDNITFSQRVLLFKLYPGEELEFSAVTGFADSSNDSIYNNFSDYYIQDGNHTIMCLEIHNNPDSILSWVDESLADPKNLSA